jgi:hypothetical protein
MSRITVRRIVVRHKTPRCDMRGELVAPKGQEWADEAPAGARRNARQAGGAAAAQHAQQDRLHLVVPLMGRHEVAGPPTLLDRAQPAVSRSARHSLARACAEPELPEFERAPVAGRNAGYTLRHCPAGGVDLMIGVRDDEREPMRGSFGMQEVEQSKRVNSARHRDDRDAGGRKAPSAREMVPKASRE